MTRKRKAPDADQSKSEAAGFGSRSNNNANQGPRDFKSKQPRDEVPQEDGEGRFPTELIRYLKQMAREEPEQDMGKLNLEFTMIISQLGIKPFIIQQFHDYNHSCFSRCIHGKVPGRGERSRRAATPVHGRLLCRRADISAFSNRCLRIPGAIESPQESATFTVGAECGIGAHD
jgi:hypothetical protein